MRYLLGESHHLPAKRNLRADHKGSHFFYEADEQVSAITLIRPERKKNRCHLILTLN
jgi:hypothetical protein